MVGQCSPCVFPCFATPLCLQLFSWRGPAPQTPTWLVTVPHVFSMFCHPFVFAAIFLEGPCPTDPPMVGQCSPCVFHVLPPLCVCSYSPGGPLPHRPPHGWSMFPMCFSCFATPLCLQLFSW